MLYHKQKTVIIYRTQYFVGKKKRNKYYEYTKKMYIIKKDVWSKIEKTAVLENKIQRRKGKDDKYIVWGAKVVILEMEFIISK